MTDTLEHTPGTLEIPPLPQNTIMLVEVGSTAHGTGLAGGEDHDEMGVVIEPSKYVFEPDHYGWKTVMQRTQPEGSRSGPGDIDRTLYSLRTFINLATHGNPSILMAFWSPVIQATKVGHQLRALGPLFIGKHCISRYRGYMRTQGMRLLGLRASGHGRRGGGNRSELVEAYGYDTKYAMHAARLGFQCIELLTTNRLQLPIRGEAAEWLKAVRYGQVPFTEWWDRALELDAQMVALYDSPDIARSPSYQDITTWSKHAHLDVWNKE